jgi:hypothetical protein
MDRRLFEVVGLTFLSGASASAALAHDSLLFAFIFAVAVGLGGTEIIRRSM